jgi:8-oxo-dGTP diphosphatase
MPHIHTEPGQHDLTASAFIVRYELDPTSETGYAGQPRLLLHIHKKMQKLLQPGGHVELDESPWAAIQHELLEEAGYEWNQLRVMQPNEPVYLSNPDYTAHPYPLMLNTHKAAEGHYHTDLSFLFVTTELPKHAPGEGESTDLRWVTLDELQQFNNDEIASGSREIGSYAIKLFLSDLWAQFKTADFK